MQVACARLFSLKNKIEARRYREFHNINKKKPTQKLLICLLKTGYGKKGWEKSSEKLC
jgi:hypothetical protein